MNFLVQIGVALIVALISMALAPKPKTPSPGPAQDPEVPTSEAGRPIPVVFGEGTVKSPNVLWHGDIAVQEKKVKA